MTRTISLITATVGAALLFAVPAWGDNGRADQRRDGSAPQLVDLLTAKNGVVDSSIVVDSPSPSPDWFERAAAVAIQKQQAASMLNAREPALGATITPQPQGFDARSDGLNRLYGLGEYSNPTEASKRALVPKTTPQPQRQGFDARSEGMNRLYGLGEYAPPVVADFDRLSIDPSSTPVTVSATSSDRDFERPTIGVGLGIAIVLLLGIGLTMKATHSRPFAH